jgi:hypothetical protein
MLNRRLGSSRFSEYKVQEKYIINAVGSKDMTNIKKKWDRIKMQEYLILPDEWLSVQEINQKRMIIGSYL